MSAYTRNTLPVVPLRGIVAMPYVILSFDLGNSANIAAVDTAVGEDNRIIIAIPIQAVPRFTIMRASAA